MRAAAFLGSLSVLVALLLLPGVARAQSLVRVGAASASMRAEDDMVIGGGIHPGHSGSQEGELRATAVVIGDPGAAGKASKVALIACDVLMIGRDYLDAAARRIEKDLGIPFDHVLINATHTHHAPSTVSIHAYERDETFCARVRDAIVEATRKAHEELEAQPPAELRFRLGLEATVGQNSRLLLEDGTIYWVGPRDDVVRPTGPFDAELPVIAFHRPGAARASAVIYNHSTHCIGTRAPGARSASFYGLAAQELEGELADDVLFISGAFGSTHNLTLGFDEMVHRMKDAIGRASARATPIRALPLRAVRREVEYEVRHFDEAAEDRAVVAYCEKRVREPASVYDVFRRMRKELAPHQGETRRTWLQAVRIGDVAFVAVPGECFTSLGVDIKRRSPFRWTYVAGVANDYAGYIPDAEAYELGGYQVWTGFHSFVERGTGERFVDVAVELLEELRKDP